MSETIDLKVLTKIKKAKKGSLFFVTDFIGFGAAKTVNKTLERLVTKNEIIRVARGIYTRPQFSKLLNTALTPSTEDIAKAIARRDRARIIPTGTYALNALGLSTQVPMNVVFLTDGASRKIKIGKRTITFKKTVPKNLATIGEISGLVIQALKEIEKDNLTTEEKNKVLEMLKKENQFKLQHDIKMAPEWIRNIMKLALSENK